MKCILKILLLAFSIPLFGQIKSTFGDSDFHYSIGGRNGIGWSGETAINYNDSADVLFARMIVTPSDSLKFAISQWYDSIQAVHIDDTLDFTYCFAMETSQQATLDLIRSTKTATLVNSPVHTSREGIAGDAISSYVKVNYNPAVDAVHWKLDNVSLAFYSRTNTLTEGKYLIGMIGGAGNQAYVYILSGVQRHLLHASSGSSYADANVFGFNVATRQNATTTAFARNAGNYVTEAKNSTGSVPNHADGIFVGCYNNNGTAQLFIANQYSWVHGGGQLTALQKTKLYEADERFLDYFGKGVNP